MSVILPFNCRLATFAPCFAPWVTVCANFNFAIYLFQSLLFKVTGNSALVFSNSIRVRVVLEITSAILPTGPERRLALVIVLAISQNLPSVTLYRISVLLLYMRYWLLHPLYTPLQLRWQQYLRQQVLYRLRQCHSVLLQAY